MIILYHYTSSAKFSRIKKSKVLKPSAPFNSKIPEEFWEDYRKTFPFPVERRYICCFFEIDPIGWKEYGLFELLMREFSGGDYLLEISVDDDSTTPILVRDHTFHSPKEYGLEPNIWCQREMRNSRPDLREKWYRSAIPIRDYNYSFTCPEVLIPFSVPFSNIRIIKGGQNG